MRLGFPFLRYYALVALQSPEPSVRVAGLAMLWEVSKEFSNFALNVLHESHTFCGLVADDWWEVQGQLMLLSGSLLEHAASVHERDTAQETWRGPSRKEFSAEDEEAIRPAVLRLLNVAEELMSGKGRSKMVIQIGLCSLAKVLRPYPQLLPVYVSALLRQPAHYRRRLFEPQAATRKRYSMGTSSRVYQECCILDYWPSVDVARTMAEEATSQNLPHLEIEHFEATVIRRYWLCRPQAAAQRALESSKKTLLQILRWWADPYEALSGECICSQEASSGEARIEEIALIDFLREMREAAGGVAAMLQSVVDQFREVHNVEYQRSTLTKLFG
eukprot:g25957.t1